MNFLRAFNAGMYSLAGSLGPLEPPKFGSFTDDRKALNKDFSKLEKDLAIAIKKDRRKL